MNRDRHNVLNNDTQTHVVDAVYWNNVFWICLCSYPSIVCVASHSDLSSAHTHTLSTHCTNAHSRTMPSRCVVSGTRYVYNLFILKGCCCCCIQLLLLVQFRSAKCTQTIKHVTHLFSISPFSLYKTWCDVGRELCATDIRAHLMYVIIWLIHIIHFSTANTNYRIIYRYMSIITIIFSIQ